MKKYFKAFVCTVLALAMLKVCSCALLPQEEVLPDAPIMRQDDTEAFTMTYVQRGDLVKEQRFSVSYRAVRQEQLSFAVDGLRIEEIFVVKGDSVKKGQILMELEQSDLSDQGRDALAQCETLRLQIQQAKQARELSRDEYALQLSYMTQEELEEADTMEEHLHAQDRAIEKLQNQLTIAEETADQVDKAVRSRQLRAGLDGVVTFVRSVSPGDVSSMRDVMITLSDSESSMFVVETKATDLFYEGQEIEVVINQTAYPSRVISAQEAGAAGENEVYLKSDLPTAELADGDSGYLMLETDRLSNVMYVENSAIMAMDGQHYVYIQDENGLRSIHPVQVGQTLNGYTVILGGLKEGDQIILK